MEKSTFKSFIKGNANIIKNAAVVFVVQLLISFFSLAMISDVNWVKLLSIVMTLSGIIIIFVMIKSAAYTDFNMYKNNLARKKIGESIPKERQFAEYKLYKGFLCGFLSVLLTCIALILSAIFPGGDFNVFLAIAKLINFMYLVPITNIFGVNEVWVIIVCIVVQIVICGISYWLSVVKLQVQYDALQKP